MAERVIINILYVVNAAIWTTTAGLWYLLWFFNPYTSRIEISAPSMLVFGIALLSIYACYKRKPKILVGSAVASIVPIGLYLLGTPGLGALIGVLNLTSLVFGLLVLVSDLENFKHETSTNE
jgi:hypothetical protein